MLRKIQTIFLCFIAIQSYYSGCGNLMGQTKPQNKSSKQKNVYTVVEQMPQFPGGEKEMFEFIYQNLKVDGDSVKNEMKFSAMVRFVVNKNGKIENIEAIRNEGSTLAKGLIRVIMMMPDWEPGKHEGEVVDVYFTIPLRISLQ